MAPDTRTLASHYLGAAPNTFWKWTENGRVLAWTDGTTIAFREELECVLSWLAPSGLPPFEAVVFLLAACREKLPERSLLAEWMRRELKVPDGGPRSQVFYRFLEHECIEALNRVSRVPRELIATPKGKAVLAEVVFEGAPRELKEEEARAVVDALQSGFMGEEDLNRAKAKASRSGHVRAIRMLHDGLSRVSAEQLWRRIQTGLDEVVEAADLTLKPPQRVRRLLGQLSGDPNYAGLAKVARDIMAAIYLPRSLSELDDLALGGVSDITNRGTLDRLLLSELAHDDLTLAVRVALNEALYIRREPPVHRLPPAFAMLLDAGIRLWGVPRLFATATALAFLAKDERRTRVAVYRAEGDRAVPVDLYSQKGLVEHLGHLETSPEPGAALRPFFAELGLVDEMEVVLVTHRDVLGDRRFRAEVEQIKAPRFYIATVDRDGTFQLHEHPTLHRRPCCEATIQLEDLLGKKKSAASLVIRERDPNLPLILSVEPFPFLLPVCGKVESVRKHGVEGGVCVMDERCLMAWERPGEGARTVTTRLPEGPTMWMGTDPGGMVHLLKSRRDNVMKLASVHLATGDVAITHLIMPEIPDGYYSASGVLFVILSREVRVFSLTGGQLLQVIPVDARKCSHDRYFYHQGGWCYWRWDGVRAWIEPFDRLEPLGGKVIHRLFSREGFEGPWAITRMGEVVAPDGRVVCTFDADVTQRELLISQNGHRLLFRGNSSVYIDLETGTKRTGDLGTSQSASQPEQRLSSLFCRPPKGVVVPMINVRRRFTHIAAGDKDYPILLRTATGKSLALMMTGKDQLRLEKVPQMMGTVIPFNPLPAPANAVFSLQQACWASGEKAFLDSRGLLHLKGRDAALPEISIVLGDGRVAVWTSDGALCGHKYFTGNQRVTPPDALFEKLVAFVGRLT